MGKKIWKVNEVEVTVKSSFDEFVRYKRAVGIESKTEANYVQSYSFFIKDSDISEDSDVSIITEDSIYCWIEHMKERNIHIPSINHYLGDVRVWLYYCMKQDYISKFSISLVKGQTPQIKYYTDDDLKKMIRKPSKKDSFTDWRSWIICCFILATGARAGTIVNIKYEDVDFKAREVKYRHLKNKSAAIIPLSTELMNNLNEYLNLFKFSKREWLFCDISENQLTTSALRQAMNKYCKKLRIPAYGPHALRHSFAKSYIMSGGDIYSLQKFLTHSDLAMCKRYINLFSSDLAMVVDRYSPLDNLSEHRIKKA